MTRKVWWQIKKIVLPIIKGYRHTGERVCADFPDENFVNHLKVYQFAQQFIGGKIILDVGCGTGYGSHFFASHGAQKVVGIDFSKAAIEYAKRNYQHPCLEFHQMDAQNLTFSNDTFDVVFSSENLEHLPDAAQNIAQIRCVVKPGGLLVLGTPNKEVSSPGEKRSGNPFHVKEFYYEELEELIGKHFRSVFIIENTLESESAVGREMKADRRHRRKIGLEVKGLASVKLGSLEVDLTTLNNTHSFMVIAF